MKKLLMMMATAAALATSCFGENEIHSIQEYEAVTKQGNVIVDFYAPWCMPCGELSLNLKKLKVDKEFVKIYKVNIDENPDLQAIYAKPQIPTILYIKNGKVLDGHIGSKTVSQLEDDIANYFY
jgi:thioredoxin 1